MLDTPGGIVLLTRAQLRTHVRDELAGLELIDELLRDCNAAADRDWDLVKALLMSYDPRWNPSHPPTQNRLRGDGAAAGMLARERRIASTRSADRQLRHRTEQRLFQRERIHRCPAP